MFCIMSCFLHPMLGIKSPFAMVFPICFASCHVFFIPCWGLSHHFLWFFRYVLHHVFYVHPISGKKIKSPFSYGFSNGKIDPHHVCLVFPYLSEVTGRRMICDRSLVFHTLKKWRPVEMWFPTGKFYLRCSPPYSYGMLWPFISCNWL
jgi:hypothetical protein